MNTSIKSKAINGGKWSLIDNLANSGLTFLVGIILARLLTPVEFGVLGLITIFINLSNTIVDGGFVTALIRKPDSTNTDYNTVFFCNFIVSVFLMILLMIFSSNIAEFFSQPILYKILPVMSLLLIINAFGIIPRTLLIKKIDFKTQAKVSLIASLGSGVLGITMAVTGLGVWSLVVQQLSRQILLTVFLWVFVSWRPSFEFSKDSFVDLFGFGSKVLIANLVNTLYGNMFLAVIGKVHSAEKLGQYNRAEQFNTIFTNNMTMVIQKVSLPVLSIIQDEDERFRYVYRKIIIFSSIITFALVFGLAAISKPLIVLLVGEQWLPSVKFLQIMSFYGFLYPLQNLNLNMLNIKKRSDLVLKLEVFKKIMFMPVILVGVYFDIASMLYAAVIYYAFEFVCNSWYSKELAGYGTWSQLKDIFPVFIVSFFVAAVTWLITLLVIPYLLMLILQIIVLITLHLIVYELLKTTEYVELKRMMKEQSVVRKVVSIFKKECTKSRDE